MRLPAGLALGALWLAAHSHTETVNEGWLVKDREILGSCASNLVPDDPGPKAFLGRLERRGASSGPFPSRDLGFGIRELQVSQAGGYCNCRTNVLAYGGRLVQVRTTATCSKEAWPEVQRMLNEAWRGLGEEFESGSHAGREYTWTEQVSLTLVRRELAARLGQAEPAEVPKTLEAAVARLMSPFGGLEVNETEAGCYESGTAPQGKQDIDALAASRRWDLVRIVARSLAPESRVYAARALLSAPDRLTADDRRVVEILRASPVSIWSCNGCEIVQTTAAKLLPPAPR